MSLIHDYLLIRKAYLDVENGRSFHVTLSELENILFCTKRNVKIILKKMVEQKWIFFVPGLGRGNPSEITFFMDFNEALLRESQSLVKAGEIEAAFQLVKRYGEETSFRQEQFLDWLSRYFGYSVEERHDAYSETLRLPVFREINTLDPAEAFYGLDMQIVDQIFDTLVEYDRETGRFAGAIAHHWTSDETATLWTFHLRKRVYFHLGRELVAEDVKFSLTRLSNAAFRQSWLAEDIESIDVLSKYTLQIKLKWPNRLFLTYLSYPPMSVVPREKYDRNKIRDELPIGTGAYRVTTRSAELCVLDASDRYYKGRALIDRIEIAVIPANGKLALKPDSNLLLIHSDENNRDSIEGGHDWDRKAQITGCTLLTLNMNNGRRLADIRLGKALHAAINRELMVEELGKSRVSPAAGFGFGIRAEGEDHEGDPDQASQLLNASMYNGEPIRLFTYERHAPDAYWLQDQLAKHGVKLEIKIVSWREMLNRERIEQADMILFEIMLSEGMIRVIENYKSHFISAHLSETLTAAVDRHHDELLSQPDEKSQINCLANIEHTLQSDYALIFLVNKRMSSSSHPSLRDVKLNRRGWVDFKNLWFNPEIPL